LQELAELEQQLEDVSTSSDRFIQTLKLIVVDSMGTLFSPLIGGASFFGHSLLVAVAQTFQVCPQLLRSPLKASAVAVGVLGVLK
jgi:hypothetical protein